MTKRRAMRIIDWTSFFLVAWSLLSLTPLSWWGYSVGAVIVDASSQPAIVQSVRHIRRDITMRYSVVVRDAHTFSVVCEGGGGPFLYRAQPSGNAFFSIVDWAGGDQKCGDLPPGKYTMDTTWQHYTPLPFVSPRTFTMQTQFKVESDE